MTIAAVETSEAGREALPAQVRRNTDALLGTGATEESDVRLVVDGAWNPTPQLDTRGPEVLDELGLGRAEYRHLGLDLYRKELAEAKVEEEELMQSTKERSAFEQCTGLNSTCETTTCTSINL